MGQIVTHLLDVLSPKVAKGEAAQVATQVLLACTSPYKLVTEALQLFTQIRVAPEI